MAITEYIPEFDLAQMGGVFTIFVLIALFLILVGVGTFFLVRYLKFNKKIVILEDVQGSDDLEPIGKDKAMLVKVAKSGMEVLYLRKRKVYKGAYGKRMGKNTYYFAIGPDGYWYNVTLGSLTDGMKKVAIKPTPVNMRYQNEALQEIIKERYDKVTFWQKYGGVVAFTILIVLFGIMAYLMFDKFLETASLTNQNLEIIQQIQETTKQIIGGLDSLKASGGLVNG